MKKPFELLAPAGTWDSLTAAINNGADAVYLGGKLFNARSSAGNFDLHEIETAVKFARMNNTKIYITVNTLLRDEELEEAMAFVGMLYKAGVDAVILQDLGLASLIRKTFPNLALHASTQMTVHNRQTALFLQDMGFQRVIAERQMTMAELVEIRRAVDIEVEVFAHGALCVSYSGQCLMSSMIGGRSGNRGRCAQPCRLEYDLYSKKNGRVEHDEGKYLLSTKDLNLITVLPDLIENKLSGIKIEGRMKRPEYVATVIRIYRQAIDRYFHSPEEYSITVEELRQLEQIFNRDFTKGFLYNESGNSLMSLKRPNNRGVFIGRVTSTDTSSNQLSIKLEKDISVGDGLEVWVSIGGRVGTSVERMVVDNEERRTAYSGETVTIRAEGNLREGDRVFKTHDEKLIMDAQATYTNVDLNKKIPLKANVILKMNEPMKLELRGPDGDTVEAYSDKVSEQAENHSVSKEQIEKQLERTGNTSFYIEQYQWQIEPNLFLPVSVMNDLRRAAIERMESIYARKFEPDDLKESLERMKSVMVMRRKGKIHDQSKKIPLLSVTVNEVDALEAAARSGADIIYWGGDLLNLNNRSSFAELLKRTEKNQLRESQFVFAMPRISKDSELEVILQWLLADERVKPKSVRVANLGQLSAIKEKNIPVSIDYPQYAFNSAALDFYKSAGAIRVTLSPELTLEQIREIDKPEGMDLEALIHGQIPVMITEYCPVGTVLTKSQDYPHHCQTQFCQSDDYSLRDKLGYNFPVVSNHHCRTLIMNSKELCLFDNMEDMVRLGVSVLRIEAPQRGPSYTAQVVSAYRHWLDRYKMMQPLSQNEIAHVKNLLLDLSMGGITKGHYFRGVE